MPAPGCAPGPAACSSAATRRWTPPTGSCWPPARPAWPRSTRRATPSAGGTSRPRGAGSPTPTWAAPGSPCCSAATGRTPSSCACSTASRATRAGPATWRRPVPPRSRLLGADRLLGVLVGDEVQALAAEDGTLRQRLPAAPDAQQLTVGALTVLLDRGHAVRARQHIGGAAVGGAGDRPALGSRPRQGHCDLRRPARAGRGRVRPPRPGDRGGARPLEGRRPAGRRGGTGVGPAVVYRLPDRVLGYR